VSHSAAKDRGFRTFRLKTNRLPEHPGLAGEAPTIHEVRPARDRSPVQRDFSEAGNWLTQTGLFAAPEESPEAVSWPASCAATPLLVGDLRTVRLR